VRLTVHRLAIREIHSAANDYDKRSDDEELGDRFVTRVQEAFVRIRENPNIAEEIAPGERRFILRGFPDKVVYRVLADRIVVIAVAHQRRREGYWRRRRNFW
jgi:toxin ParE1/3/4